MVTPENEERVRRTMIHLQPERPKWRHQIGKQVRMCKRRQAFEKG